MSLYTASLDRLASRADSSLRQQQQQQQQQYHHHHHHKVARPPTYDEQPNLSQKTSRVQHIQIHHKHHQSKDNSNNRGQAHTKSKQMSQSTQNLNPVEIAQAEAARHQRTLMNLFQIYAILVISLALIYAIYHFCNQQTRSNQSHFVSVGQDQSVYVTQTSDDRYQQTDTNNLRYITNQESSSTSMRLQQEMEQKIQLLQKYIELIAVDLQDTRERLKEREKCQCSISCKFNNTSYVDGSTWQQQCDTCTCQSGRITCAPIKCPKTNCDDPVKVPGQCCPVCMKRCKFNQLTIKHNQTFKPSDSSKECKCQDGLIKCSVISKGSNSRFRFNQNILPSLAMASGDINNNKNRTKSSFEATSGQDTVTSSMNEQQEPMKEPNRISIA